MDSMLYQISELSEKTGISAEQISEWIKTGIITPEGFSLEGTPLLSSSSEQVLGKINSLLELGYAAEEIKKIVKKVGLPDTGKGTGGKNTGKEKFLTVGNLAEKTGLSPRTIKHWEEKGIIEPALRSAGGFRLYRENYVLFCSLIKDLQLFGYSLDEIKNISAYLRSFNELKENPEKFSSDEKEKMAEIFDREIENLLCKTSELREGIKRWEDMLRKQKKQLNVFRDAAKKKKKGTENDEE